MSTFGERLRAKRCAPTTAESCAFVSNANAIFDVLFAYPGFLQFIAEQCERSADTSAHFWLEKRTGGVSGATCALRCTHAPETRAMRILSSDVLFGRWPTALRDEFVCRLKRHFDGVIIDVGDTGAEKIAFSLDWRQPVLTERMLCERFDRLEELIKALPPTAGGAEYLRAKERFEGQQTAL